MTSPENSIHTTDQIPQWWSECDEHSIEELRMSVFALLLRPPSPTQDTKMSNRPNSDSGRKTAISAPKPTPSEPAPIEIPISTSTSSHSLQENHISSTETQEESATSKAAPSTAPAVSSSSQQALPGFSVLAQVAHQPFHNATVASMDPEADWEIIQPAGLVNLITSVNINDSPVIARAVNGSSKSASVIEQRASHRFREADEIALKLLGDTNVASSLHGMTPILASSYAALHQQQVPPSSLSGNNGAISPPSTTPRQASNPALIRNIRALEILNTEAKYLLGLEHVLRNVLGPLQVNAEIESSTMRSLFATGEHLNAASAPTLTADQIRLIFGPLESMYVTNANMFAKLMTIFSNWDETSSKIGELFLEYAPFLKVPYLVYVNDLENALAHVSILAEKNSQFRQFLQMFCALKESQKRPLADYLSTPYQRIMRYKMLLVALREVTPEEHPDAKNLDLAIALFSKIVEKINASNWDVERRAKMIQLQSRFGAGEEILKAARTLILEDDLASRSLSNQTGHATNNGRRPVFLFTDSILTTTVSYSGYLYRQYDLPLQSIVVMDRPAPPGQIDDHSFWVLAPMQTYIFLCPDAEKKTQWMTSTSEAITKIVSASPEMKKERDRFVIHLFPNNVPVLIPAEAENNPSHAAWKELSSYQSPKGFFSTIWGWFSPAPAES